MQTEAGSRVAMTDEGDTPPAKKQKGSKSYPKGVIETGRNTIKYQARVSYKPDGGKTDRRCSAALEASTLRRRRRYR